jgi:hypothetical protein
MEAQVLVVFGERAQVSRGESFAEATLECGVRMSCAKHSPVRAPMMSRRRMNSSFDIVGASRKKGSHQWRLAITSHHLEARPGPRAPRAIASRTVGVGLPLEPRAQAGLRKGAPVVSEQVSDEAPDVGRGVLQAFAYLFDGAPVGLACDLEQGRLDDFRLRVLEREEKTVVATCLAKLSNRLDRRARENRIRKEHERPSRPERVVRARLAQREQRGRDHTRVFRRAEEQEERLGTSHPTERSYRRENDVFLLVGEGESDGVTRAGVSDGGEGADGGASHAHVVVVEGGAQERDVGRLNQTFGGSPR